MDPTRDQRIDAFAFKIAASGYDSVQANTIGRGFGRVKRDLMYLEITAADYKRAAADVLREEEAFWRSEFEPSTRELTTADR